MLTKIFTFPKGGAMKSAVCRIAHFGRLAGLTALSAGSFAAALAPTALSASNQAESSAPTNIVYLNADDLGWADLGVMGSAYYETPNLDRLARQGMLFTDAYAAAANCAPSRAVVYTGQYTPRHGVHTVGDPARGDVRFRRLIPAESIQHIREDNTTFVSLLKDRGYATWHIGKWHVSENPLKHGFDVNIGGSGQGNPGSQGYLSPYNSIHNLPDGPDGEQLTFRLTNEAIRLLRNHDTEQPFFLSMQYYVPHLPLQALPEVVAKYEEKAPNAAHSNPIYAAMIDHLDVNVGRLMDALEEIGVAENTLVLFTSDNGGIHGVSRQWPLRGEKGSYYEGGIRVPLIVRWPGRVRPGSRSTTPVSGVDFFPTFLEVAGVDLPEDKLLDGLSFVSRLKEDGDLPERALFWHFPSYLQAYWNGNVETRDPLFRTRPGSVVRMGKWKLHEYFEDGGVELYDLEKDIGERVNLVNLLPKKAAQMHTILKDWREKSGAPVPSEPNPNFDAEAEAEAIREFWELETLRRARM